MEKVYVIPNDFVFSPCKVDGDFWSQFHTLLSYLGRLEDLIELRDNNPEAFKAVIEPLILFVKTTEEELHSRGFLEQVSLEGHS